MRQGAKYRSSLLTVPHTPDRDTHPLVGIGLGWEMAVIGRVAIKPNGCPYAGIYVDMDSDLGKPVREAIMTAGARERREQNKLQGQQFWPVWRYVELEDHWWADLDGARSTIVAAVTDLVDQYEEFVRRGLGHVVGAAGGGG